MLNRVDIYCAVVLPLTPYYSMVGAGVSEYSCTLINAEFTLRINQEGFMGHI